MRRTRINDMPEDSDKQAGDGLVAAPYNGLLEALDIVHDLKHKHSPIGYESGELEKLEKALNSMIKG